MVVKTSQTAQNGPQTGFQPYRVQVTTPSLHVRLGPSTAQGSLGLVHIGETYTIVEESTGPGAKLWGKLEDGKGWISLDYTKKV